jgi:hypothetical protein
MIADPLLSHPRVALGGPDITMTKHFTNVFQGHSVVEHHISKRMSSKVRVKGPFDAADHRKFF